MYDQMIADLIEKRNRIDHAISTLRVLGRPNAQPRNGAALRGRKFMSTEERKAVSIRMKRYWSKRRNGKVAR